MILTGQKYRATKPLDVIAFSSCRDPCTSGSKGTLAKGEVFTINQGPNSDAIAVYCVTENYKMLHATFISESDRSSARYRGYYLCVAIKDIVEKCERVSEN